MLAAIWKNDLRHYLILLNFIAFGFLIIYLIVAVLSPKRARKESGGEEQTPGAAPQLVGTSVNPAHQCAEFDRIQHARHGTTIAGSPNVAPQTAAICGQRRGLSTSWPGRHAAGLQ